MRIAIDARYLNETVSGIAKYGENLINALSQLDTENEYTVFIHKSFNRRLRVGENFDIVSCPYHPVSFQTLAIFGNVARKTGADFLHSLSPVAPLYGVRKQILTLHDLQPFIVEEEEKETKAPSRSKLASLFYKLSFPHAVRSTTWFISVSQATKDRFALLFPEMEHKTISVHSGVEGAFFESPEATIAQMVVKKLNLPPQYILYIGSAQPHKNVPAMIRAFKRVRQNNIDKLGGMQFILVLSQDRYVSATRRLILREGIEKHVRIVGPVTEEEKRVLYHRATALFFCTRGEGFGFPLVEAQAMGLPVLTSDDAAAPEIIGGTGVLVPPQSEARMTDALSRLLIDEDYRRSFVEPGRENAKRFMWKNTARKVLDIYRLLM
jgi:glycosyltransferase involved in cell wall biosynthesis